MPNLYHSLIIAFIVIILTIASLALGWLVKGKMK